MAFSLRTGPSLCPIAAETQVESPTLRSHKPGDRG